MMMDSFVALAPLLLLPVVGLMRFIGCTGTDPDIVPSHVLGITPEIVSLMPGQTQQFHLLVDGTPIKNPENISWHNAPGGFYKAPTSFVLGGSPIVVTATTSDFPSADAATANVKLIGIGVKFLPAKRDTGTQGAWKNNYGNDGWALAHKPNNFVGPPVYLKDLLAVFKDIEVTPVDPQADARGLQNPATLTNFAASWFKAGSLDLYFPISDFEIHRIAIYCVDWDVNPIAVQKFEIFDFSHVPPLLLDTRTLSSFGDGIYLVWEFTGPIRVSATSDGAVAVISGIFFDHA